MRSAPRHLMAAIGISAALVLGLSCRSDSTSPEPVATVTLTPPTAAVDVGATVALTAQAQDAKGNVLTGRTITFVSSDTNMATVSASGVVTGIAPGAVNVSASADTKSAQSQVTVSAVRDDWTTYGHDVRRTSASLGSVTGPLSLSWSYVPQGTAGHALTSVLSAIGTANAIFVRTSLSSGYGYGISPAIDRVSPTGQHVWTFNMTTDADFGDWASLMGNRVIVNSDGARFVDQTSGLSVHGNGVDTWGEILTDSSTLYFANDVQIDGPGIYAAAYDTAFKARWTANKFTTCRGSASAMAGGLALNNGVLFYAPAYTVGKPATVLPFSSGVFALNATTGAQVAYHASTPYSRVSADASHVYLIENQHTLVALAQSDLHVVWSATIANPGEQAPVVANGLVIIGTSTDVEAYNASSGAKSWSSATLTGAAAHLYSTFQGGSCGSVQIPVTPGSSTTIAAALGSRTLVVTASDGVHILALGTGADLWHGRPAGIPGTVSNPVIVNDPARGAIVYVEDYAKLYALAPPPALAIVGNVRGPAAKGVRATP
ncbi:MAG TPA: PQQ-binding-like beta-propeller repeat protein [Gemmatimonadaceae bacterium]|nr:PQQ-binding-like beta-propeller repeat protein [Gemmatimonadaceae bacterium]